MMTVEQVVAQLRKWRPEGEITVEARVTYKDSGERCASFWIYVDGRKSVSGWGATLEGALAVVHKELGPEIEEAEARVKEIQSLGPVDPK